MAATHPATNHYNNEWGVLDSISDDAIESILESWSGFCITTESLLGGGRHNTSAVVEYNFVSHVHTLYENNRLLLTSLVKDHFFRTLEETFERNAAKAFWRHFEGFHDIVQLNESHKDEIEQVLCKSLEYICLEKQYQEKCLLLLLHALESSSYKESNTPEEEGIHSNNLDTERVGLFSRYQLMVYSVLTTTLPHHFSEILRFYFMGRLEELSAMMSANANNVYEKEAKDGMDIDESTKITFRVNEMDIDETYHGRKFSETGKLMKDIGKVVCDLRSLGFTFMTEDAYAASIFLLLKTKVHDLAKDDYRSSVLDSIKEWIRNVPLQYLYVLLAYLGDSVSYETHDSPSSALKSPLASHPSFHLGIDIPSEGLVRWQLRLEYFAYETLQDLRIAKLFEIIVDYPDSSPAINDLKQCLKYTGQHSKLVDTFISSLRYRLLTAGASTNDILHQYVSTIKALRIIDPTGVFLAAVREPIRDYLKGRKDTRKCIVSMLTEGPGGNPNGPGNIGENLLEELNRDEENQETGCSDDDYNCDEKQAWINAECWEPDPVEADPLKGSTTRRKVDILGMVVGIIGSKDQLVNEYHVMLAEKLLNKCDYDIDSEIRTLELLKIHFGESSMQKCEIMLSDLINSKRINTNIKASIAHPSQKGADIVETEMSLDLLDATIISSNSWPPMQEESINLPKTMDQLLSDYARRYNEIKTPRKLLWKKNLGIVKLELRFGDATAHFIVDPVNAAIIMHFQDQTSWTSKDLAAAIGIPVEALNRRINFWISKGVISESIGAESDDRIYALLDGMVDNSKNSVDNVSCEDLRADEEVETSFASQEQLRREMVVYEKFILGMLTNFGSMSLDQCHNNLKKRLCSDTYDKSLQQLQNFLSGLQSEEKIESRDGMYYLRTK